MRNLPVIAFAAVFAVSMAVADMQRERADEQRKSGLGSAAHSRRVAEARHQHREAEREQVSHPEPEAAVPNMADFPRESPEECSVSADSSV
jgi:hypothetical protein